MYSFCFVGSVSLSDCFPPELPIWDCLLRLRSSFDYLIERGLMDFSFASKIYTSCASEFLLRYSWICTFRL